MTLQKHSASKSWLPSQSGVVLLGFLAIAAFFLWEEHRAHLLGVLPYVLLLLCPILHLLHGGHGGHDGSHGHKPGGGEK